MFIGVRAFGVNVWSNFILIRHFDWPYKKFIIRSAMYNLYYSSLLLAVASTILRQGHI